MDLSTKNMDLEKIIEFIKTIPVKEILLSTLVVGIIYQFMSLGLLGKLMFFSRTQVINDTAVFLLPITLCIFTFLQGYRIYPLKKSKRLLFLIISIAVFVLLFFFSDFSNLINFYLYFSNIGFFMGTLSRLIYGNTDINKIKKDHDPYIVFGIFLLSLFFMFLNAGLYKNLFITGKDGNNIHINYMNDQYIFTNNGIIPRNNTIIFHEKDLKRI